MDPNHPTKHHDNIKLERITGFSGAKARYRQRCSNVEEVLTRSAADLSSGMLSLGSCSDGQRRDATAAQKHKSGYEKVVKNSNKLQRLMCACDSRLPTMRRSMSGEGFQGIKDGLHRCRDRTREDVLYLLEDLKDLPEVESAQEERLERFGVLSRDLAECIEALQEAMAKM